MTTKPAQSYAPSAEPDICTTAEPIKTPLTCANCQAETLLVQHPRKEIDCWSCHKPIQIPADTTIADLEAKVAQLERERDELGQEVTRLEIQIDGFGGLTDKLEASESALSEARERTIWVCIRIVENTYVQHGDQYASYTAPSIDSPKLAAELRNLLTSSASAKGE